VPNWRVALVAAVMLSACSCTKGGRAPTARAAPPVSGEATVLGPPPTARSVLDFVDRFVLMRLDPQPTAPEMLLETAEEQWAVEPSLSTYRPWTSGAEFIFERATRESDQASRRRPNGPGGRIGSELVVRRKPAGPWYALALAGHAVYYPIIADPKERDVIWIGCSDGPPGMHVDYLETNEKGPRQWGSATPLYLGGKRGGLARVDVRERSIRYFGPDLHLVDNRVEQIVFDENAVWVWGHYPMGGSTGGIARYDRAARTFTPILYPTMAGVNVEKPPTWTTDEIIVPRGGRVKATLARKCTEAQRCAEVHGCDGAVRCATTSDCTGQSQDKSEEPDDDPHCASGERCALGRRCALVRNCAFVQGCDQIEGGTPTPPLRFNKRDLRWNVETADDVRADAERQRKVVEGLKRLISGSTRE
jgi:hypothetical protein